MATSRPEELEDLLQPTLRAEADPARMRGAWSPWSVALFAIVGGPLTAGVLYGENYRRLGRPALLAWCVGGALVLIVAAGYGAHWMLEPGADENQQENALSALSVAIAVLLAFVASLHQQRLYRIFVGGGGEGTSPWKAGLVALLVGGWLGRTLMAQVLRWAT